jgi:hypothetical protein
MNNLLVQLIQKGKVRNLQDLKSAYHRVIMKTHPDAAGSDRYLESYLGLASSFQEARAYLAKSQSVKHPRLSFFQQLHLIESLEMPYAFHPAENMEKLLHAKEAAGSELLEWKKEWALLYKDADREYVRIKTEKPFGPYLKHALALNVRPLMHDLIAFHLTGRDLYAKQARQNLPGIMHQLSENHCVALREFLSLLLEDAKKGAAVLD